MKPKSCVEHIIQLQLFHNAYFSCSKIITNFIYI